MIKPLAIICLILGVFSLHSALGFWVDPPPWSDEAVYLDIASNLAQGTSQGTELWHNVIPGVETYALWNPRLFFFFQAGLVRLFGPALTVLRLASAVIAGFCLVVFYLILRRHFPRTPLAGLLSLGLALNYAFIRLSRLARPDTISLLLLLLVFYSLTQTVRLPRLKLWPVLAGVGSGLAGLIHPLMLGMPLVTLAALGLNLFRRSFKPYLVYLSGFFLPLLIWAGWSLPLLPLTLNQMRLAAVRKNLELPWAVNLFFSPDSLASRTLVLLTLILVIIGLSRLKSVRTPLWRLTAGFFIGLLLLVLAGRMIWYWALLAPFILLVWGWLWHLSSRQNHKPILVFWLAGFIGINLYQSITRTAYRRHQYAHLDSMMQAVGELLPPGSRVFLSSIPDAYFYLQDRGLILTEFPSLYLEPESYRQILSQQDFAVFSENITAPIHGPVLPEYLEAHEQSTKIITNRQGLTFYVVKLQP